VQDTVKASPLQAGTQVRSCAYTPRAIRIPSTEHSDLYEATTRSNLAIKASGFAADRAL
jgi:hypothetical protein